MSRVSANIPAVRTELPAGQLSIFTKYRRLHPTFFELSYLINDLVPGSLWFSAEQPDNRVDLLPYIPKIGCETHGDTKL